MESFDTKKSKHKIKKSQQLSSPAQITVVRRESSMLNAIEVWDICLNGENIGSIKDGESITASTSQSSNVLEAKHSKGAVSAPLKFIAESGSQPEVDFKEGKFVNAQEMHIILAAGKPGVFEKIKEGFNSNILIWVYWVILIGYHTGVFLLTRGQPVLGFVLPTWPFIMLTLFYSSVYKSMVGYLSYNHTVEWVGISREICYSRYRSILSHDGAVIDTYYDELRTRYRRIYIALIFSVIAYLATCVYSSLTTAQ